MRIQEVHRKFFVGRAEARPLIAYAVVLGVTAVAVAAAIAVTGGRPTPAWAVAALAVLSAIAERSRVRLSSNLELSISLLPMLFAAVVFGPAAAMIVGAASLAGDAPIGRNLRAYPHSGLRWIIYTLSESITGGATGFVALAVTRHFAAGIGAAVAGTAASALTAQTLDAAFSAFTIWLRRSGSATHAMRTAAPVIAASVPLYAPVVGLLAYTYEAISPWTLPLFLVPALAAHRLFTLYQEQIRLTADVVHANERLERANLSFATALVATLDARDRYTAGHSAAVAIYARDIAERMGLSREVQQRAHLAGLVHDIGKIGLPAGLLEKPGALTLEERRMMETHSAIGARILANVDDYADIAAVVRHHHERVDGNGYPDRLSAADIPLLARIIAVADAYNAMTSDRPYRDAMPSRVARLRLAQAVENQFDTAVVAAFEAILANAGEDYRLGRRSDFVLEREEMRDAQPAVVRASA